MNAYVASYDRAADVLYVAADPAVPSEGQATEAGLVLEYDLTSGHPSGITVVGFARYGWRQKVSELGRRAARHLTIDQAQAVDLISAAALCDLAGEVARLRSDGTVICLSSMQTTTSPVLPRAAIS